MKDQKINFKLIEGIPEQKYLDDLVNLYTSIFEDAVIPIFIQRLQTNKKNLSLIAYKNKIPVGFKIGYKYNNHTFYSWVGGTLSNYRKKGIANTLAKQQENWAKNNGFTKLRTKSMNRFKPMLILNLKNGFDIVQVYTNEKEQTKIIFEKLI